MGSLFPSVVQTENCKLFVKETFLHASILFISNAKLSIVYLQVNMFTPTTLFIHNSCKTFELLVTEESSNLNRLTHPNSTLGTHRFLKLTSERHVNLTKKKIIEASRRLWEQQGGFSTEHHIEQRCVHGHKELLAPPVPQQASMTESTERVSLKIGSLFTDDMETYIKSTGVIKLPRKEHNRGRNTALTKENLMLCQSRSLVHMTSELCCSGGQSKSSSCHFLSLPSISCHRHYFSQSWIKNNGKKMIEETIISSAKMSFHQIKNI